MTKRLALAVTASALLAGCSLAPAYHVPTSVAPVAAFKSDPGWVPSNPSDAIAKGAWWMLFGDDTLNALEVKVAITNQNLAYYRATYAQALTVVRVDQAALLPTVGVTAGASRTGAISTNGPASSTFSAIGTASWTPDLWGALTNTKRAASATAQASAAELANATLSAQGTLATDYFTLRGIDAQAVMLDTTLIAYRRSFEVTRNKYAAGTASQADVDSAQSTLANAEASRRDLDRQRVANETAIAVLVGENPSAFAIAKTTWAPVMPTVPGVVPSAVLERRPDIANAERLVSAANSTIGVQRAAFFPAVSLTAQAGCGIWRPGRDIPLCLPANRTRTAKRTGRRAPDVPCAPARAARRAAGQSSKRQHSAMPARARGWRKQTPASAR